MPLNQIAKPNLYIHHHHHHHQVALTAQISLILSLHPYLSSIGFSRSSKLHPVSAQSWCKSVLAGRQTILRPCVGVHRRTSLMSSFLLPQQCFACFVNLTWIDFEIGSKWPYSCCFVGCYFKGLFKTARSIVV